MLIVLSMALLPQMVSASVPAWIPNLKVVAAVLGWLFMVIMGIKWILADSPNERAEAKKGMMYIVVGLLVIASACQFMCLYRQTVLDSTGVTIDVSSVGCTC